VAASLSTVTKTAVEQISSEQPKVCLVDLSSDWPILVWFRGDRKLIQAFVVLQDQLTPDVIGQHRSSLAAGVSSNFSAQFAIYRIRGWDERVMSMR